MYALAFQIKNEETYEFALKVHPHMRGIPFEGEHGVKMFFLVLSHPDPRMVHALVREDVLMKDVKVIEHFPTPVKLLELGEMKFE